MRNIAKAGFAALVLLLSLQVAAPCIAGPVQDAEAAIAKGDYATALKLLRPVAEQGTPEAQLVLAIMHGNGMGVPRSGTEAVKWSRKAAEQGHANAQHYLGLIYKTGGHGDVPKDYVEAMVWFRKAADQGHTGALFDIGTMYDSGHGVTRDHARAWKMYLQSAELGDARSQFFVALIYAEGDHPGVPRDYAAAASWYRKAADQGDAAAQFNLGTMYDRGQGVPQDNAQAVKWWRSAADSAHPTDPVMASALYNLGVAYARGVGVPQDYVHAHMWFNLAAAVQRTPEHIPEFRAKAAKERDAVAAGMTPAQIAEAQRLAREWKPR
jgi:TPR repeat protein